MKNIVNKIILAVLAICAIELTSCKKVLESSPDGKISIDDVFSDNFKVAAFLNTCYTKIPTYACDYWFNTRGPVVVSDEAWDADDIDYPTGIGPAMYNGNATPTNNPMTDLVGFVGVSNGLYWERYFSAIRNCALFISRIETATVDETGFLAGNRKKWKAEAHILRAFYYSELLRWYGTALPIVRDPYSFDSDFSKIKRSSYYEVVKFIIEDCNIALNTPELNWRNRNGDADKFRATKAMAEAIKSRAILYAASPLYNENKDIWEEAYQVNKASLEALRTNGYELYKVIKFPDLYKGPNAHLPNATANFPVAEKDRLSSAAALINEYFTRDLDFGDTPRDKETIYSHWADMGLNYHTEGIGAQGGYKSGTNPSQELVDAYETFDGQPILDLANPYLDEKHIQPNYNPNNTKYDPANPYANRDPRFYASVYYNGSQKYCHWATSLTPDCLDNYKPGGNNSFGVSTRIVSTWLGEPLMGIDRTLRYATRTGYFLRKFLSPNTGDGMALSGPREKIFRLGEVILNYAEAAAESGHLTEARDAVNEIRNRAGMPDIPAGLSKADLILRVRHERRIELALEGRRYFDVRRWQKPDGDLSKTDKWITAMEITRHKKPDGSFSHFTYQRRPVRNNERLCYTNKYLKPSIPQAEVNKIYGITGENWQNPGW